MEKDLRTQEKTLAEELVALGKKVSDPVVLVDHLINVL